MSGRTLLGILGLVVSVTAIGSGCAVTRGVPTRAADLDELREVVQSGPTPSQQIGPHVKSDPSIMDHYLHASGRVRCSGLVFKKQTVFVHGWTTAPGAGGSRVDVPGMSLSFDYLEGLFAGITVAKQEASIEELSSHETITGVGDICSCVYLVAEATLLNTTRLQVKEKICPE